MHSLIFLCRIGYDLKADPRLFFSDSFFSCVIGIKRIKGRKLRYLYSFSYMNKKEIYRKKGEFRVYAMMKRRGMRKGG